MFNLRVTLGIVFCIAFASATAGLSSRAAAQGPDWPPDLTQVYPDWQDGDKLIKPIKPQVMRQMAEAVLVMAEGAFTHVDEAIVITKENQDWQFLNVHLPS